MQKGIRRSASFAFPLALSSQGRYRPPVHCRFHINPLSPVMQVPSASTQHNIQLNHTSLSLLKSVLQGTLSSILHNLLSHKNKMAPITPLMRMVAQRRTLSIFTRARAVVRTFEPHPFERLPLTQKAAKADWGKQIRHVGDAAMLYVPLPLSFPS